MMAHLNRFLTLTLTADKDPGSTLPRTRKRRKAKFVFAPDIRVSRKPPYEHGLVSFASSPNPPLQQLQAAPTRAINAGLFVFSLS
jgi:hypothetical protein